MKPEQENFDALQRLLKLKRHEIPPPGYFNDFSSQVIMRIKVGGEDKQETFFEYLFMEAPWVKRLLSAFESKPAVAWGFGLAACALIVSGVVFSETVEYTVPVAAVPAISPEAAQAQAAAIPAVVFGQQSSDAMMAFAGSTNPITRSSESLFDQIQPPSIQPVSGRPSLFGN